MDIYPNYKKILESCNTYVMDIVINNFTHNIRSLKELGDILFLEKNMELFYFLEEYVTINSSLFIQTDVIGFIYLIKSMCLFTDDHQKIIECFYDKLPNMFKNINISKAISKLNNNTTYDLLIFIISIGLLDELHGYLSEFNFECLLKIYHTIKKKMSIRGYIKFIIVRADEYKCIAACYVACYQTKHLVKYGVIYISSMQGNYEDFIDDIMNSYINYPSAELAYLIQYYLDYHKINISTLAEIDPIQLESFAMEYSRYTKLESKYKILETENEKMKTKIKDLEMEIIEHKYSFGGVGYYKSYINYLKTQIPKK